MARLFFAVELPTEARAEASRVADEMRGCVSARARFTPAASLHLTLKFIDDLESERIPRLLASAARKLAAVEPFRVALSGSGAFPSLRAARVLWIGVGEGGAQLARIARKLDRSAGGQGVPRDPRPFRAHLTLARLREPAALAADALPAPDSLAFSVGDVVLYESRLSSAGATHVPLTRLPLGATEATSIEFAPEP
jgi:2'-5' RNA ligase